MNNLQEQGRTHYNRGEHRKAIELFDRAIGRTASVQLLDNRAACYEKLSNLTAALKDAKKAIQLHREAATGYLRAGKILVKMEKQKVALEIYTHGLKCIRHVGRGYELLRKAHKDLLDELSPPRSVDPLTVLPRELAEVILEYLSFRQRMNASLVSKQWAHFVRSAPNLWRHLDLSGARKKVRTSFISRAINIGRLKLTKATLSYLYDFDKTLAALIKHCPLQELVLLECGLQGFNLTNTLTPAKHLRSLKLGEGVQLVAGECRPLIDAVADRIEFFHCTLKPGTGAPLLAGVTFPSLKVFSMTLDGSTFPMGLLQKLSECMPLIESLTFTQVYGSASRHVRAIDLTSCLRLTYLDLSLPLSFPDILTLPSSLKVLKLAPTSSAEPAAVWNVVASPTATVTLPHLEELSLVARGTSLGNVICTLLEAMDNVRAKNERRHRYTITNAK
ncbi:hypothetical protein LTR37_004725 [Vermiconidia calcicola]|uniref:Uncharacterized protein n=1 Tax=Vermiconidia calcicola TaxID=1690605 RepID=A0ACC3NM73_9PEZI|nr:hypothetical protein LTR37_004725 [Vermiconidia calcicola]